MITIWHCIGNHTSKTKNMKAQNTKRTFIVDDDPFWTAVLTQMLNEMGYTNILTFPNGEECLKNLHLNPNLVFVDYQMDDMDGIELLQKIKDYYPGIGVVFCTAHEDLSVAVNAIKYGSFDYLLKSNAYKKELSAILQELNKANRLVEKTY